LGILRRGRSLIVDQGGIYIEESRRSVGDRNGKDGESEEKIREGRGRSY